MCVPRDSAIVVLILLRRFATTPPTTMRRTLETDEIVQGIVSHVERNVDLHSVALVCRALYAPALDKLWSELDGLKPLIRCLPDHCTAISSEVSEAVVSPLSGSLTSENTP